MSIRQRQPLRLIQTSSYNRTHHRWLRHEYRRLRQTARADRTALRRHPDGHLWLQRHAYPDGGIPIGVANNPSYLDVLPSVQMRYRLTPDSALRAVYARGVARPDAYQLVPHVTEDQTASPVAVSIGNPSLKPENATADECFPGRRCLALRRSGILPHRFLTRFMAFMSPMITSPFRRSRPARPYLKTTRRFSQRWPRCRLSNSFPEAKIRWRSEDCRNHDFLEW